MWGGIQWGQAEFKAEFNGAKLCTLGGIQWGQTLHFASSRLAFLGQFGLQPVG